MFGTFVYFFGKSVPIYSKLEESIHGFVNALPWMRYPGYMKDI